jgi:hypothetical protein
MAGYNEILAARYNRFMQKLFTMKGSAVIPQLASDIQPAINVFSGAENRYLEMWNRYGSAVALPNVAAQTNGVQLRNPTGSNIIIVVESAWVGSTTAQRFAGGVALGAADLPLATAVGIKTDQRQQGNSVGVISTSNTTPSAGSVIWSAFGSASQSIGWIFDENQEIVLTPGVSTILVGTTVNTDICVAFGWRERSLEESERT